jgi:hypothetical protein
MGQVMSGQRNQMDEYVRRASNAGVTRGGQNVQGGPSYASAANQQAMSNLASGYEDRFNQAMSYLANQYTAQNQAWKDAAEVATQMYGVQQQGLNTLAGDISSARNYAAAMSGQGSAEKIAGIEQQTALGTAGIQKEWQEFAAQKQLEAAIQQAEASKYGADIGLQGTQAQVAAARYQAELEKAWQEQAAQKQYEAAARQAQASEYGATQAAGAQKYAAEQGKAGQLGAAELTSGATKYASDQERLAQIQAALYGKEAQLGAAEVQSAASKYAADLQAQWQKYAAEQAVAAAAAGKTGITPEQNAQLQGLWGQLESLSPAYTMHGQHLAAAPTTSAGLPVGQMVVSHPETGNYYSYTPTAVGSSTLAQLPTWTGYQYEFRPYASQPNVYDEIWRKSLTDGTAANVGLYSKYSNMPSVGNTALEGTNYYRLTSDTPYINWVGDESLVLPSGATDPYYSMYYMDPNQASQWNSLLAQIQSLGGNVGGYKTLDNYASQPISDYYMLGEGGLLTPYSYATKTYNPTTNTWG